MAKKGRKPDYRLKVFDKNTEESGEVGVGWLNDNGSISIRLNSCVVLGQVDLLDKTLILFREDGYGYGNKNAKTEGAGPQ